MSTFTEEKARKEANEIVDFLMDKLRNAAEQGEEHVFHFLQASSFALGSCIALAVERPSGIGPILGKSIETLTDGVQSGMKVAGMNATFIKIKRDRP